MCFLSFNLSLSFRDFFFRAVIDRAGVIVAVRIQSILHSYIPKQCRRLKAQKTDRTLGRLLRLASSRKKKKRNLKKKKKKGVAAARGVPIFFLFYFIYRQHRARKNKKGICLFSLTYDRT